MRIHLRTWSFGWGTFDDRVSNSEEEEEVATAGGQVMYRLFLSACLLQLGSNPLSRLVSPVGGQKREEERSSR